MNGIRFRRAWNIRMEFKTAGVYDSREACCFFSIIKEEDAGAWDNKTAWDKKIINSLTVPCKFCMIGNV